MKLSTLEIFFQKLLNYFSPLRLANFENPQNHKRHVPSSLEKPQLAMQLYHLLFESSISLCIRSLLAEVFLLILHRASVNNFLLLINKKKILKSDMFQKSLETKKGERKGEREKDLKAVSDPFSCLDFGVFGFSVSRNADLPVFHHQISTIILFY